MSLISGVCGVGIGGVCGGCWWCWYSWCLWNWLVIFVIVVGVSEFTIVTGLRCDGPEKPITKETPHKRSKASRIDKPPQSNRGKALSERPPNLKDKTIPKPYREKLFLVWFAHSIILAKDVNKVIEDDLLTRVEDFEKFNNYPWEYDSFYLTVKYLLKNLSPAMITLYGFPWTFMVVHQWIVPTEQELGMTSFITLGHVDTIANPIVELIKKELVVAIAIRRVVRQDQPNVEALHDQTTAADLGASSDGVVSVGGRYADASTTRDDEHVNAQEKINMIENTPFNGPFYLYTELGAKEKRDLQWAKNAKPGAPYYPRPSFSPQDFKIMTDIYMWYEDKYVDKILCLMWKRQLKYPEAYDAADRIMDLDFWKKLKNKYDSLPHLSKLMYHSLKKVLMKKSWDFDGRNKGMNLPKIDTSFACCSYILAHIKCLLTSIKMHEPTIFLCDNIVENLQEVWAYGVLTGLLDPMYKEEPVK
ncbi:hypothetical protein FXO38_27990 [Capsicum annuum]|nr:hypothetical protein FXO38_27990 [Capsicum annuum]